MVGSLIIEILILWVCYAAYMAVLVHKRGPVGGIFICRKLADRDDCTTEEGAR